MSPSGRGRSQEMRADPRVFVMGEDIGNYGGIFGATAGLFDEFGEGRVRDTPISETGFIGAGNGHQSYLCLIREQAAHVTALQEIASYAAEYPFAQPRMAIGAGDDQIDTFVLRHIFQLIDDRSFRTQHRTYAHFYSMPQQVSFHILKLRHRRHLLYLLGDFDEGYILRYNEIW